MYKSKLKTSGAIVTIGNGINKAVRQSETSTAGDTDRWCRHQLEKRR